MWGHLGALPSGLLNPHPVVYKHENRYGYIKLS
jgi:hypothetical protein